MESIERALAEDELIEYLEGVHLHGIRSKTQVTQRVLVAAPTLTGLGAFCIGTNQIDIRSASELTVESP